MLHFNSELATIILFIFTCSVNQSDNAKSDGLFVDWLGTGASASTATRTSKTAVSSRSSLSRFLANRLRS